MCLKLANEFLEWVRGMTNRQYLRRRTFLWHALSHAIGRLHYSQCALCVLLSFLSADPLCMARWSVVSLLIKYCGSSFEARTV